jgi:hypothetical protein
MASHNSYELPRQTVKIAAHYLLLVSSSSTSDLVLTYSLQLCHFGACASADMGLLSSILKDSHNPLLL